MNNDQFRKLILANSAKSNADKNGASPPSNGRAAAPALGSRQKSSIPMTPRSVARPDFARQLAERNQSSAKSQQSSFQQGKSKVRSSAPKGSKLAQGYVDRARTREEEEEEDERLEQLKALKKALKEEEIDHETYERRRTEIAGGDLESTHLVKGLDFKLLERVRRGEDVYGEKPKPEGAAAEDGQEPEAAGDSDDELERLEATEVTAVAKEKTQKKGQLATTGLNLGQKRSRNQILAEMKAARAAAKAKQESALGSKFKKIGAKKEAGTRFEVDSKGREVMIIVDEDGHERRKIRKLNPEALREREKERQAFVPDKDAEVLGMEVPEEYKKQLKSKDEESDGEINIFDDAGSDYDPLADLRSDSDGEVSDEEKEAESKSEKPAEDDSKERRGSSDSMPPPPKQIAPIDYFKDSKTKLVSEEEYKSSTAEDPNFLAALRKAKALSAVQKSGEEQREAERQARLKMMLEASNRDDEDMDLGFGSSRLEDEADLVEEKVKLSAWDADNDGPEDGHSGGGSKRKRGPKKRKGDKNSFADVMRVMERNKGAKGDS